jgi:hypothetical protein
MENSKLKKFKMTHMIGHIDFFTEETAPKWLKEGGRAGSTMDNRWFWNNHVMILEVGQTIDTDFSTIERME